MSAAAAEEIPVSEPVKKDRVQDLLDNLESHEFSCAAEEHPVKIKDKDGKVTIYRLRELDGSQRSEYLNFQASKAKMDAKGNFTGMKDVKGLETRLLSMSLLGPDNNPVPEAVIAVFPGRLVKDLAAIALRISGLDDAAQERAKNS